MREASLLCNDPAAVFYDFKAAFPSISHQFLHASLESVGLPVTLRRFVLGLYWNHGCSLAGPKGQSSSSPQTPIKRPSYLRPMTFFSKAPTYDCSSALNDEVPGEKVHLVSKTLTPRRFCQKTAQNWAKNTFLLFLLGPLRRDTLSHRGICHSTQNYRRK